MTLNAGVQALLQMMEQAPKIDFQNATPADARAIFDAPMNFAEPIAMARIEEVEISLPGRTLAARLYVPDGASPGLTVYFHGGGWVIGTLETHDGTCRALAKASGAKRAILLLPLSQPFEAVRPSTLSAAAFTSGHVVVRC